MYFYKINDFKNILTVLISFNGDIGLKESLEYAKDQLIKYAHVKDVECFIIKKLIDTIFNQYV